ncbi:hypothetical protein H4219_005424 [Mycoemilia scoparia]|uniref:Oxysterol-binding protein n=1 Tax=Mycoemilia scoparia TaxID=417184 RepID=A0A9W7ZMZ6_9FUNG|nr:hypothetical protein H4219_005424 [Mycoemilia scoparia]
MPSQTADLAVSPSNSVIEKQNGHAASSASNGNENAHPADLLQPSPSTLSAAENVSVEPNQSKVSAMFGILKKVMGVKDIINLRLSLPAQLLDPIPNLEHWNFMDRPDFFVRMSDPEDPLDRMLNVFKWWIAKDIKHVEYRVCKPFNSILGEQFFCHWDVNSKEDQSISTETQPNGNTATATTTSANADGEDNLRVEYITEQISHHPPISAYCYRCKEKNIEAVGLDHMSAKFSGISATVSPGSYCHGTFVTLKNRDNEMYQCLHAPATVAGWLTGSLRLHFTDCSHIICADQNMALILEYKEGGWFSKAKDLVEGKIIKYEQGTLPKTVEGWKLKDIPKSAKVLATISGSWRGQVFVTKVSSSGNSSSASSKKNSNNPKDLFIELPKMKALEKLVKPLGEQHELESRKVWNPVIEKMLNNQFGEATKAKRAIEDAQRQKAADREKMGEKFVPQIFEPLPDNGIPVLLPNAPINV